jgi:hypothetical protein
MPVEDSHHWRRSILRQFSGPEPEGRLRFEGNDIIVDSRGVSLECGNSASAIVQQFGLPAIRHSQWRVFEVIGQMAGFCSR